MKLFLLILVPFITMQTIILFVFTSKTNANEWQIVDDGVMGGKSQGEFKIDTDGNGVFFGTVSLENNGGFSSVRHQLKKMNTSNYSKIVIRLKGDGKMYQFRVKDDVNSYFSYITTFKTTGAWEEITINTNTLYPSFRGRTLDLPNYSGDYLEEMVFLVGNKKNEAFQLIIDKIQLVK